MKRYTYNEIDKLADILKNDGVISVPTDTVYGLCARINSKKAYDNLVNIKNRPNIKLFPVVCLDEEQIKNIAIVNKYAEKLIHAFMPGPITLVFKKKDNIPDYITNGKDTIAVRMAPLKILEELIEKTGMPLFLTSANISGKDPCNNLDDIEKTFPDLDGILEGNISYGQSSTIVDCTNNSIKIQREGPIKLEDINYILENN